MLVFKRFTNQKRDFEKQLAEQKHLNEIRAFSKDFFGLGAGDNGTTYVKRNDFIMNGKTFGDYCGEWSNDKHLPHGRGVFIYPHGAIRIGYFDRSFPGPGSFIHLYMCKGNCCYFDIGEVYLAEDGKKRKRGMQYTRKGVGKEFDEEA